MTGVCVDDPTALESDSVTFPGGQFHLQPEELAGLQLLIHFKEVRTMG